MEVCGGHFCKEESQVQGTNPKQLARTRACDGTGDQRSRFQPGSPEVLNDKAVKGTGKR